MNTNTTTAWDAAVEERARQFETAFDDSNDGWIIA